LVGRKAHLLTERVDMEKFVLFISITSPLLLILVIIKAHLNNLKMQSLLSIVATKSQAIKYWRSRAESVEEAVAKQYAVKIRKTINKYNAHFSEFELDMIKMAVLDSISKLDHQAQSNKVVIASSLIKIWHKAERYNQALKNTAKPSSVIEVEEFDIDGLLVETKPIA